MQTPNKVSQAELHSAKGHPITALRYAGDISSASKEPVLGTYHALDHTVHRSLLLDFSKVEYLNSSGIALVIQLLIDAGKAEQTVAICGLTPHFTKVFTMVGITKYATLYPNEAAALAAL
ncbi:MAG TPA: STAS domain-containing protein [Acidobacteriaceae bacterium]